MKNVELGENTRRRQPTERMIRIHGILAAGTFLNSDQLAARLGVSRRTIKRDLEYLRDHLDRPIEYDVRRGGYRYSGKARPLPGTPEASEEEILALLLAKKMFGGVGGAEFKECMEAALEKLAVGFGEKQASAEGLIDSISFRAMGADSIREELFRDVTRAVRECCRIGFNYRKAGERGWRTRFVDPYHLACVGNRWYLIGKDLESGFVKRFAMNRVDSLKVREDERFSRPSEFDAEEFLKGSLGVMGGTGDYEVVIEFDAWATDVLHGRKWHESQVVDEMPGGGSRMTLRLSCLKEVSAWVLGWGERATVIRPAALVEMVAAKAKSVVEKYGSR